MKSKSKEPLSHAIQEIKVLNLSVLDIITPKLPMRADVSFNSLKTLVESIKEIGLINPIAVMQFADKFEIVAGARNICMLPARLGFCAVSDFRI